MEICGKAEWFNPGGSVKDRPALGMIDAGLKSGALVPGKTIIDATSGNTGIAYAMIGAALGYPVTLCLPDSASHERKRMLAAYGAELVMTPGDEATDGAIRRVQEIVAADPRKIFLSRSVQQPGELAIALLRHRQRNLGADCRARHAFRSGTGHQRHLYGRNAPIARTKSRLRCISLQPDAAFHGLEGWKHMATALVPAIYDAKLLRMKISRSAPKPPIAW